MREIVLDTETTGLEYKLGHRIIEVGCVELKNHIPTGKTLQFYCSTNKNIDEGAVKVHGLTNNFLQSQPSFAEQVDRFLDFIKDDSLIIHNADFDLGFINNELRIIGKPKLTNQVTDTVFLARKTLGTRIANLDYLCRRFSVDLSERKLHGALLDSHLLAAVYLELMGGKQISMNLKTNSYEQKDQENPKNKTDISSDIYKINTTQDEINQHKALIKQIKNPLWDKIDY